MPPEDFDAQDRPRPSRLRILVPTRAFWGLPLLLDVNILVYIAMVVSGAGVFSVDIRTLLDWGADYRPALQGWGLLRLITSQFVHIGLFHVATNMYGLFIAGILIAPVARNARLVACYLLCGLGGAIASAAVQPEAVAAGASGAIFGLFGMLFALTMLGDRRFTQQRGQLFANAAFIIGINLLLGFVIPGIGIAAHIGGLVTGFLLGVFFFLADRPQR